MIKIVLVIIKRKKNKIIFSVFSKRYKYKLCFFNKFVINNNYNCNLYYFKLLI